MIALIVTLLIDTAFVKINDLIDKNFMPIQSKIGLFSANSSICLLLQFIIIKFVTNSFGRDRLKNRPKVKAFYIISLTSFFILTCLIGLLIFQQLHNHYYETWVSILIVTVSYGTAAIFIIWLSFLFFTWYKSNHDLVVLLYFVSMSVIAFNLIMTAVFIDIKLTYTQHKVAEYIGSSGDSSGGRDPILGNIYRISSFMSFFSIWLTTAILMNSYREKLSSSVTYWIILGLPLVYFLMTYFYQFFLSSILSFYFQNDPLTVSILVGSFLSLSKPIGGLIFGIAFWKMSRMISYERNMRISMAIAGWGIFFIFSANQAATLIISPYPPFGVATLTILNVGAYLMLLGVYNSASLVSANIGLRKFIYNNALKLLNPIGEAELKREIQKAVKKISENQELANITTQTSLELDENELKKYLDQVIREVKKEPNLSG